MNPYKKISPFVFLTGILILIVVFWAYIHFFVSPKTTQAPKLVVGTSTISGTISSGIVTYTSEEKGISITYPDSGNILNAALKDAIALEIRAYEKSRLSAGCTEAPTTCELFSLTVTIESIDTEPLASFLMRTSQYTGGAHEGYHEQGLVFDKNGIQLELSDIFQGEYLIMFSDVARQQIGAVFTANGFTDSFETLNEGTEPTAENFSSFYIHKGLVFLVFSPYQVAPWAMGMQYAVVPFDYLDGYVKADILSLYEGIRPPSIVLLPKPQDTAYGLIVTEGFARTFESNVSLYFESNKGTKVATATTALAPDIGFYGYFSHSMPLNLLGVQKGDTVKRDVVDHSAKDGSDVIRYTDEFEVAGL